MGVSGTNQKNVRWVQNYPSWNVMTECVELQKSPATNQPSNFEEITHFCFVSNILKFLWKLILEIPPLPRAVPPFSNGYSGPSSSSSWYASSAYAPAERSPWGVPDQRPKAAHRGLGAGDRRDGGVAMTQRNPRMDPPSHPRLCLRVWKTPERSYPDEVKQQCCPPVPPGPHHDQLNANPPPLRFPSIPSRPWASFAPTPATLTPPTIAQPPRAAGAVRYSTLTTTPLSVPGSTTAAGGPRRASAFIEPMVHSGRISTSPYRCATTVPYDSRFPAALSL